MNVSARTSMNAFFGQYSTRKYAKGQVFLLEGETSDYVYYLLSGRVKVYTVSYRGDEVILHIYKPFDFFPVSHVLDLADDRYIYEADADLEVRRAPIEHVRKILEAQPAITLSLLKQAYRYINASLARQSLLMAGSARSKLIYELIVQCRSYSTDIIGKRYVLDVREKDLAARTGVSRETINREVKKLKNESMITFEHRYLIVLNIDSLELKLGRSI